MATGQRRQASAGEVFQRNLKTGATLGAAAYVVGYIVTTLFAALDGVDWGSNVPSWKGNGWLFYGTHNVETTVTLTGSGQSASQNYDIFADPQNVTSTIPEIIYLLVPALTLAGLGYLAYKRTSERQLDGGKAGALGATVIAGYFPLAALGAFLFEYSSSFFGGTATVGPEVTTSIVLVGIVYPVVFGAVGAVVAHQRAQGQQQAPVNRGGF